MDRLSHRRYRIVGTLTTVTPIHIGSGRERIEDLRKIDPRADSDERIRIKEVLIDHRGKPYLPGSTIKGLLREFASRCGVDEASTRSFFGVGPTTPATEEEGSGGRLLFRDAPIANLKELDIPPLFNTDAPPLAWDPEKLIYVLAKTALNRVTRTVRRHKLYHFEVVPEGLEFQLAICGDQLTDEEVGTLIRLLEVLETYEINLGALGTKGFGQAAWKLGSIRGLREEAEVRAWLAGDGCGYDALPALGPETVSLLKAAGHPVSSPDSHRLRAGIRLDFDGPFLVNDPTSTGVGADKPDHHYLRSTSGRILLPATSVRGALRAQAERIVRTIAHGRWEENACYIDDPDHCCQPLEEINGIGEVSEKLCLVCQLFGGNGWRSPVRVSDFEAVEEGVEARQEFVAIDRFTGGAADGKKFNAHYRFQPSFEGEIVVDLTPPLSRRHAGLLVLLARDLIEGDIVFGFGASKGFGRCRATITRLEGPADLPDWLSAELITEPSRLFDLRAPGESRLATLSVFVQSLAEWIQERERR